MRGGPLASVMVVLLGCVVALFAGEACWTSAPATPPGPADAATTTVTATIVLVADPPSHGPGEHEYRAGTLLLAAMLAQSPGVSVKLLPVFPADAAALADARAIVLYSNGAAGHPLLAKDHAAALDRELARGAGLACLHWSTEVTPELADRMLGWLGGYALRPDSVFSIWDARFVSLVEHPVTRGVAPFELHDEWYFGLHFGDASRVHPVLIATPPDALRTTPPTAATPGRAETLAWTFDRAGGGRSFGYTGAHFHAGWGRPEVRRLVVNAILWTAGIEVPASGAKVEMEAALLGENLDPKP